MTDPQQPSGESAQSGSLAPPPSFSKAPAEAPAFGQPPAGYGQGFGQAPAGYGQATGTGTVGIIRNPWVQWLMMIIPIYNLVHLCSVAEQLKRFDRRVGGSGVASFFAYIPGTYALFIPPIVLTVRTAGRIRQCQRDAGAEETCSTALSVVLLFVLGLNWWYWQSEMNKIWARYPGAVTGSQVPIAA